MEIHTEEVVEKIRIYKASREGGFGKEQLSVPSFPVVMLN